MYRLEKVSDGDYCIFLSEGIFPRVTETDSETLSSEILRVEGNSRKKITASDLSSSVKSFIVSRTGKEFN